MECRKIKKIVIIGPESTGKSTLSNQLAEHYKTLWVKEYAREYLLKHGTNYTIDDLYKISQGQLAAEDETIKKLLPEQNIVIIDTDMYVMKVWSEFVFNKCDNRILSEILKREYDLYLLCDTDLPWTRDELREYPDDKTREKLFLYYKEEMSEQKTAFVIINGFGDVRLQNAIAAIEEMLA
jgi:NadR type nicotinamide-nucleotide adenylyltransferase